MLLMRFPGGVRKALTLSYDDGLPTDARLMEILDRYGIKCTFNVNAPLMQGDDAVLPERVTRQNMWTRARGKDFYAWVQKGDHEIAVHGATHAFPDRLNEREATVEYLEDKKALEAATGSVIRGCAYAMGTFNDDCKTVLRRIGIRYARTVRSTFDFGFPKDFYEWDPTCHHSEDCVGWGKKFLEEQSEECRLFYLWGHSCEFEVDGNWDVIEAFCALFGERTDVWFATNLQVTDYLDAYARLEVSSEERAVFNPSALDVFLEKDGKLFRAQSGKVTSLEK